MNGATSTSTSVDVPTGDDTQARAAVNGTLRAPNGTPRQEQARSLTRPNGSPTTLSQKMDSIQESTTAPTKTARASRKYKHTFAVHSKARPSIYSSDSTVPTSSQGFRNLMGLVIVISNIRLMMDNFKKYGLLVTLSGSKVQEGDWKWFGILYLLTPCHLLIAYWIELAAARYAMGVVARKKREGEGQAEKIMAEERRKAHSIFSTWFAISSCHALNATIMLAFATYMVYYHIHNPGLGTITELHAVIVWLKVCSYAFTNRDLRSSYLKYDSTSSLPELYKACPYPQNINIANLSYFWWAPTLVYQPVYPRSEKRRYDFIAKRICEFVILCVLIWVACAQYAVPTLKNSLDSIASVRGFNILERIFKLSTISLVCWLAGFFALFQSFLNALAEIMRFGDREFYGDWWNSNDLRSYWTSWNKPVTNFMKRHIYAPMVGRGVPPVLAQTLTFVFSGFLHELLVGIPTHNLLGLAFFGMVGQIPLILFTDMIKRIGGDGHNSRLLGNCTFWLTFVIFGQPIAAMMYFFAWQAKFGDSNRPEWPFAFDDVTTKLK